MYKACSIYFLYLILSLCSVCYGDESDYLTEEFVWIEMDQTGKTELNLYFFWSEKCPHCVKAQPFVEKLPKELNWLKLHSFELSQHPENVMLYESIAKEMKLNRISVPAFIFCGNVMFGFDSEQTTGKYLVENLKDCLIKAKTQLKDKSEVPDSQLEDSQLKERPLSVPLFGELEADAYSLPTFTFIIALMDAFNPCAFFVLLFLLSLLTHTHRRKRMLFIGGVFVFFSGLVYFLFMSAWLNMFMLFGKMQYVTLAAGLIAITIAIVNIKDYFAFKKGVSLSIPDSVKPKLIQRMRKIINADNMLTMFVGTVLLALFANTYELLCTAGFPMVYTRHLTLLDLPMVEYYVYLILYNLIYIIPLSLIVVFFVYTLGSRKVTEKEGRALKLASGFMMLGLGLLLLFMPEALNNVFVAIFLIFLSILFSALIIRFNNSHQK